MKLSRSILKQLEASKLAIIDSGIELHELLDYVNGYINYLNSRGKDTKDLESFKEILNICSVLLNDIVFKQLDIAGNANNESE